MTRARWKLEPKDVIFFSNDSWILDLFLSLENGMHNIEENDLGVFRLIGNYLFVLNGFVLLSRRRDSFCFPVLLVT